MSQAHHPRNATERPHEVNKKLKNRETTLSLERPESLKSRDDPFIRSVASPWSSQAYRVDTPARPKGSTSSNTHHQTSNLTAYNNKPIAAMPQKEAINRPATPTAVTGSIEPTHAANNQARPGTPPTNPWRASRPTSPASLGLSEQPKATKGTTYLQY